MGLREPTPIPVAFDFTRFLASSITFMNHLSAISVYFDDKRFTRLTKSAGIPKELILPKTLNVKKSKMMALSKLQSTCECIVAFTISPLTKYSSVTYPSRCNAMGLYIRLRESTYTFCYKTCKASCFRWFLCFPIFWIVRHVYSPSASFYACRSAQARRPSQIRHDERLADHFLC